MTTKTLGTLIPDIERIMSEGAEVSDEIIQHFSDTVGEILRRHLEKPLEKQREKKNLWATDLGKPDRQVWYAHQPEIQGEDVLPHVKIKFLSREIWEAILLALAEIAGHEVSRTQERVEYKDENGDVIVSGRADAMIDGEWVEVKSSTSRQFGKFTNGTLKDEDLFGYIPQAAFYPVFGDENPNAGVTFFAVDVQLGKLALLPIRREEFPDVKTRADYLKTVIVSPTPPPRTYDPVLDGSKNKDGEFVPNGNEYLPPIGAYDPYKYIDWADANEGRGLVMALYSNGPKWFTKIVKAPRVPLYDQNGELIDTPPGKPYPYHGEENGN